MTVWNGRRWMTSLFVLLMMTTTARSGVSFLFRPPQRIMTCRHTIHNTVIKDSTRSLLIQSKREEDEENDMFDMTSSDDDDDDGDMEYHSSNENENDMEVEEDIVEEEEDGEEVLYRVLVESVEKALMGLEKKQGSLEVELEKSKQFEAKMERGNLIIANLYQIPEGCSSVQVMDWNTNTEVTLQLDTQTYNSAQEEANALFQSARKMKRGSQIVDQLLHDLQPSLQLLQQTQQELTNLATAVPMELSKLQLIQKRLQTSSKQTGFQLLQQQQQQQQHASSKQKRSSSSSRNNKSLKKTNRRYVPSFRQFQSQGGCTILVGKTRRDNEAICFQVSKPNDIWMHARGCPGAHVLIPMRRGSPSPTEECMQLAANLAAFYSDARTERKAPITTTQAKHLQKPRNAPPGAVKIRQEGPTYLGNPTQVPPECQEARDQSGQLPDESGSTQQQQQQQTNRKNRNNNNAQQNANAKSKRERKSRVRRLQSSTDSDDMDFF